MEKLVNIENWFIRKLEGSGGQYIRTAIATYADYRVRHLNEIAASVSFYAIFSVFPLLAFTAYLVGAITGKADSHTGTLVMSILTDFIPGIQGWIQNGIFDLVKGKPVENWINAILLAWSSLGFFSATNTAIGKVPDLHKPFHRSYIENIFFAVITLSLFAVLIVAVIYTEYISSAKSIPLWLIPTTDPVAQNLVLMLTTSGALLAIAAILTVAITYYILMPYGLRFKYALIGGILFSTLLVTSRAFYWIYLHYNKGHIESVYGAFSTLILIMLWVHFVSNCFVFSGLYAHHLDKASSNPQPPQ